jgi:DHA1 family inner membrane transport protein
LIAWLGGLLIDGGLGYMATNGADATIAEAALVRAVLSAALERRAAPSERPGLESKQ